MILERLHKYIIHKALSISAFEKSIGMSNASFGKSLKNKGTIGCDKLERIFTAYPDINIVWLLTGKGEMINPEIKDNQREETKEEFSGAANIKDSSIIARIYDIIAYSGLTVNEFSIKTGVSNGYFAKQRSVNGNIGSQIIEKIINIFPEISIEWLITGRGSMLQSLETESPKLDKRSESEDVIKLLLQELGQKNEEIGRLKERIDYLSQKNI